jgi:hypothetical protein
MRDICVVRAAQAPLMLMLEPKLAMMRKDIELAH